MAETAPSRIVGVHCVTDGRYEGDAIWIDFEADKEKKRIERNGLKASIALDRQSAVALRRELNRALKQTGGLGQCN